MWTYGPARAPSPLVKNIEQTSRTDEPFYLRTEVRRAWADALDAVRAPEATSAAALLVCRLPLRAARARAQEDRGDTVEAADAHSSVTL